MTGAKFLLAFLCLPILGLSVWTVPYVARLPLPARLSVATASGALLLPLEMFLFDLAGIPWSVPLLALPLLAAAGAGLLRFRKRRSPAAERADAAWPAISLAALALLFALYAAATARATSVDLLLTWGTKGLKFAAARGIDVAFLAEPANLGLFPDYPPLLPLLYAWATLFAGRMAWGAALLTMPFFLLVTTLGFWGFARTALGGRKAGELTALLAALLAFGCAVSLTAGNAEPVLLFFEVIALAALNWGGGRRETDWIAGAALAGTVWTKVEGAAFAAIVIASFLILERRGRRLSAFSRLAGLPAGLLGLWLLWAAREGLLYSYGGGNYGPFSLGHFREVLSVLLAAGAYGAFYLPWVFLLVLLLPARSPRRARPNLAAAAGYLLFIVYCYLHGDFDPRAWIEWSAPRLLLTPLLLLFFGAAAAAAPEAPKDLRSPNDLKEQPVHGERGPRARAKEVPPPPSSLFQEGGPLDAGLYNKVP